METNNDNVIIIVNLQLVQHSASYHIAVYVILICVHMYIHPCVVVESGAYTSKYASQSFLTSCTQMLFCRNSHKSVVEYLVGIPNSELTYAGKSDGSSILHFACR